ncbi:MAG: DUF4476 domain-containing protein [Planctomycetota bacterium]|nr:DUF4476 domain-containing protein [Planctomycetota bacterium]
MSRFHCVMLAILALLITSTAKGQRKGSAERDDRVHGRAAVAVDGLKKDLCDARRLLVDVNDRKLRDQLELLLSRAALKAEDLEELLASSSRGQAKLPISDEDFSKLLKNLKDQSFDEQKVEFIETFAKGRPLSCAQATELLKTLSFDDGRIKAAIILHPGLVDAENFFEVLKVFPFDSNRKQVMEAVKKKD